jgi:hypothetical protein
VALFNSLNMLEELDIHFWEAISNVLVLASRFSLSSCRIHNTVYSCVLVLSLKNLQQKMNEKNKKHLSSCKIWVVTNSSARKNKKSMKNTTNHCSYVRVSLFFYRETFHMLSLFYFPVITFLFYTNFFLTSGVLCVCGRKLNKDQSILGVCTDAQC